MGNCELIEINRQEQSLSSKMYWWLSHAHCKSYCLFATVYFMYVWVFKTKWTFILAFTYLQKFCQNSKSFLCSTSHNSYYFHELVWCPLETSLAFFGNPFKLEKIFRATYGRSFISAWMKGRKKGKREREREREVCFQNGAKSKVKIEEKVMKETHVIQYCLAPNFYF